MTTTQLPFGLKRFAISLNWPNVDMPVFYHVAKTQDQAWSKFSYQRFGYLKPDRSEWNIRVAE